MTTMVAAVLTMTAAQLLDLATFAEMVRHVGSEAEANPLVSVLFGAYGLPIVAIAKVALLGLVVAIVVTLASRPRSKLADALVAVVLVAGIGAGIVGGVSNVAAIGLI
jgi:hypothetical protein